MDEYIGVIKPFAVSYTPRGWLPCDGRTILISGNEALYSIIGNIYGGDGITNFALPDLRGRFVVGQGKGTGLTNRQLGQSGGAETVTIDLSTYPAHTHASFALSSDANSDDPSNCFLTKTPNDRYCIKQPGDTEVPMNPEIISTAPGGNQEHDNMPPFMAINYIICVQGTYPVKPN